jgi:hypothetical protein
MAVSVVLMPTVRNFLVHLSAAIGRLAAFGVVFISWLVFLANKAT